MTRLVLSSLLVGCSQADYDVIDTGAFEEVVCSHPNSQFEAQVEVNYQDEDFTSVEIILGQNEEFWIADLQRPNEDVTTWHATMQILEFDCYTDFTYNFVTEN